ncbi:hypothetical protein ACQP2U_19905 [Nocardia sp. CA-084685]|uniref:hypothetical protein n=1 Tax=Nocardia sp. CA-084685 TaxID=3239970 RepID=UPI003D96DA69
MATRNQPGLLPDVLAAAAEAIGVAMVDPEGGEPDPACLGIGEAALAAACRAGPRSPVFWPTGWRPSASRRRRLF